MEPGELGRYGRGATGAAGRSGGVGTSGMDGQGTHRDERAAGVAVVLGGGLLALQHPREVMHQHGGLSVCGGCGVGGSINWEGAGSTDHADRVD